jgi:hypothetical protein
MQRHFLNLELGESELDPQVREWWGAWRRHPVLLPRGRYLPEITLSVPLAGERLLARYDLLALPGGGEEGDERVLIVDWKTQRRPRSREELAADIQTQLYPFVLGEGGAALALGGELGRIPPDRITMVYWQANDPANPLYFPHSTQTHTIYENHLKKLVAQAQALRSDHEPPLIDDLTICARCTYATYCCRARSTDIEPDWDRQDGEGPVLEPSR